MNSLARIARSKVFGVAPAISYAALVFVLGSLRVGPAAFGHSSDKLWHALAFGLMQYLNYRALLPLCPAKPGMDFWREVRGRRRAIMVSWFITAGIGGLLELWQSLLVYRSAEWGDALADALGAFLVAAGQWGFARRNGSPRVSGFDVG